MTTRRERDNGMDGFVGEHDGGPEADVLSLLSVRHLMVRCSLAMARSEDHRLFIRWHG